VSHCETKKKCQKVGQKEKKVGKKLSKRCPKVVQKLSKSCQKVVKKLSKSSKKLTKGSAMYHWSFYVSREAIKRKNQQRW
jgi:hypothetical protein